MRFEVVVSDQTLDYRDNLSQLPIVELEVDRGDHLLDVSDRALNSLGVGWEYPYTSFVSRPDENGRRLHVGFLLAYVDDDGILAWTDRTLKGVLVRHLERTHQEGLFVGDPRALLVEQPTGGDGVLPDSWDDLVRWLIMFGAAWQGGKSVAEAARSLASLVERAKRGLEARRAKPWALFPLVLERDVWDYGELAQYLNLPLDVIVDMLTDLGYRPDANNGRLYRQANEDDAAELRDALSTHLVGMPPRESKRWLWQVQGKPHDWTPP
jgi:hypothetical protein